MPAAAARVRPLGAFSIKKVGLQVQTKQHLNCKQRLKDYESCCDPRKDLLKPLKGN